MSYYKQWAEESDKELTAARETITRLRRQLIEREEEVAAAANRGYPTTGAPVPHEITNLHQKLQEAQGEKEAQARELARNHEQTQNVLKKLSQVEKETQSELETLRSKLAGKDEELRLAQANRASDLAPNARERKLKEEVEKQKSDCTTLRTENARLRGLTESLQKQLQVEKSENAKRLAFMASDPKKVHNEDDEEVLPRAPAKKQRTTAKTAKKRKLSTEEEIGEELSELQIGKLDMPTGPRKKKRISYGEDTDGDNSDYLPDPSTFVKPSATPKKPKKPPILKTKKVDPAPPMANDEGFNFKVIYKYEPNGDTHFHTSVELRGTCEELWSRIEIVQRAIWERKKGEYWQWDFQRSGYSPTTPPCVTQKCQGKRTRWRSGFAGEHACKDCVEAGRPCFTYVSEEREDGYEYSEFVLLPLHDDDRMKVVVAGKNELCYWVNDETKCVDPDTVSDDEYTD